MNKPHFYISFNSLIDFGLWLPTYQLTLTPHFPSLLLVSSLLIYLIGKVFYIVKQKSQLPTIQFSGQPVSDVEKTKTDLVLGLTFEQGLFSLY